MRRITTEEAARIAGVSVQQIRMMIQLDKIPGASCHGPKYRRTYYITDDQVANMMKGACIR